MKKLNAFILIRFSLMLFSPAWAGSDEDLIRSLITDQAKAFSDFPRSRDKQAVLKLFSQDYSSVTDGVAIAIFNLSIDCFVSKVKAGDRRNAID